MEDLSEVLQRHYLGIYKKNPNAFESVETRVAKRKEIRKMSRHDALFEKRKIPQNMTPIVTPASKRPKVQETQQLPIKRLEMLAKWKAEKEQRKRIEKQNAKPVFKVSAVSAAVGLPDLENVNREVKGKRFKSNFAPANHKFKPPANIQPINFHATSNTARGEMKQKTADSTSKHQMVTRSRTANAAPQNQRHEMGTKRDKKANVNVKNNNLKKPAAQKKVATPVLSLPINEGHKKSGRRVKNNEAENRETRDALTKTETQVPVESEQESVRRSAKKIKQAKTENNDENKSAEEDEKCVDLTPTKSPNKSIEAPTYISPFVTISRGKSSAKKEFEARKSCNYTSPKAGAAYFDWTLDTNIERLRELSDQWIRYKQEENLPEEAVSMIDVAIGQTNLLITQKFQQFRGLISKCKNGDSDVPITCKDLHGFWDMVHIQVVNLDKRFDNLNKLKEQNWIEIVPEVKQEVVKKKSRAFRNVKASTGLRAAIMAARMKKEGAAGDESKSDKALKTPEGGRGNRLSVVRSARSMGRNSSPGLAIMKVAQYAKGVETPNKSILKSDGGASVKNHCKVVLFQDEIDNIENCLNEINIHATDKTPKRRSIRLLERKFL